MLCRQVAKVSILNPPARHSPCLAGYCISGLEMGSQGAGEGGFGATLVIRAVSGSGWGWGVCVNTLKLYAKCHKDPWDVPVTRAVPS